jgi:hypothetical protein
MVCGSGLVISCYEDDVRTRELGKDNKRKKGNCKRWTKNGKET